MSRVTLGQNIFSLRAQSGLRSASAQLQDHFERLSSGLRINKASDDAAGLSISSLLDLDRRVSTQGLRNINDAVSLLNIADGAVSELSGIVTRIKELATQASNGTFTYQQRLKIDAEAQALSQEYERISKSTKFNGLGVLSGEINVLGVQLGYGVDGAILSRTGGAISDGTFQTRLSIACGASASTPTVDDINFDGQLDAIYLDGTNVTVRMGNGDGSFSIAQSLSVGGTARAPRIEDFDNDGYLDIVSSESAADVTYLFRGTASGTFSATAITFATGTPEGNVPFAFDYNSDGNIDLAYGDTGSDAVLIRLGNGDGTFNIRQSIALTANPLAVSAQDANGDGILDFLVSDSVENTINVFLGNGDGTFRARISTATGTVNLGFGVHQDLNGDGHVDLHLVHNNDDRISIWFGNGNGTFKAGTSYQVGNNPQVSGRHDVDNDGYIDLIVNDRDDDTFSILLGNSNGTFRARYTVQTGDLPSGASFFRDFNGDGAFDIFSYDSTDDTISLYISNTKSGAAKIDPFSLISRNEAMKTLAQFQQMEKFIGMHRGTIGAFQSRLQTAMNVTAAGGENFAAARSRITDIDVASESAGLVRSQILQQVSTAILAQANQMPALALRLLNQ